MHVHRALRWYCISVNVKVSVNAKYELNGTLWNRKHNARNGYWTHFVVMKLAMKDQSADNANVIAMLGVNQP